jgi:hypothetical protein
MRAAAALVLIVAASSGAVYAAPERERSNTGPSPERAMCRTAAGATPPR